MENIKALLTKYLQQIIGKTKEVRDDKNALIFLVFLFLSACFWVLNALQKDNYTTEVSYPIKFVNVGEDEIINGSARRELNLKIKGGGFKILNYLTRHKVSAKGVDISGLRRISLDGVTGAYINSNDYFKLIEDELVVGIELVSITPDTLFIPLLKKQSKILPVKVVADYSFAQQCQLSGPIAVQPDSVTVSGAAQVLDSIEYIQTRPLKFEKLADTIVRNVALEKSDNLELSAKRVVVTLPVEPFTEANVMVPIKALNLPDSLQLKTFPSEVNISYHLGLSRPLYLARDFNVSIDFSSIDLKQPPRRLKVRVSDYPGNAQNMSYQPLFVEYLLERKTEE
ncbi:YbbR-like domain-containing protein [Carboxylicivirga mesophila]|uniref:YbbR-like domain-containing protein n=1 Tax=Carboxylicivirga mesophila TaxID=1166478 RepID=A0ABS5KG16_9BACT|nr:CdaR family protein [Carboxylicivirga mesophila]MBS2213757.1 YbbR-like domain-containing protein [Carboxylicivirga mesophila]